MVYHVHAAHIVLGIIGFFIIKARQLPLFKWHLFSSAVKLFPSDAQYYVPLKLCRMAGSIHLFELKRNSSLNM